MSNFLGINLDNEYYNKENEDPNRLKSVEKLSINKNPLSEYVEKPTQKRPPFSLKLTIPSDNNESVFGFANKVQSTSIDELLKNYIDIFKENSKLNNDDIVVPNPINKSNTIKLGDLFETICNELIKSPSNNEPLEYIFENIIINNTFDRKIFSRRDYSGVYELVDNSGKSTKKYDITSSTTHINHDIIKKEVCILYDSDDSSTNVNYIKGFVSILHEVCMQYYAYTLLYASEYKDFIVIPKLYKISLEKKLDTNNMDKINCISIYMQNINKYEISNTIIKNKIIENIDNTFNKWNPRINGVFGYFEKNNLAHYDTAYKNVFFINEKGKTSIDDIKLAIIDFGESIMPHTEKNIRIPEDSGYCKINITLEDFKKWMNGKKINDCLGNISPYWGGKQKRTLKRSNNIKIKKRTLKRFNKRKTKKYHLSQKIKHLKIKNRLHMSGYI